MAWGRLDDGFDEHAKTLALLEHERGVEAVGLWTLCLAYAHRSRRKGKAVGMLPAGLLRRYVGRDGALLAELLCEVGYWEPVDDGGWRIVNFDKYLPTEKTSEIRAAAGRKGAAKRWEQRNAANGSEPSGDSSEPSTQRQTDGKPAEPDSKPMAGDGNAVANDGSRADARAAPTPTPTPTPVPEEPDSLRESTRVRATKTAEDPPDFAAFWAAYPRKTAKGSARTAWDKARKKAQPEALIAAAARYRQLRAGTDPQFTPHAATWLNQERWLDDPVTAQPAVAAGSANGRPRHEPYRNPTDQSVYDEPMWSPDELGTE